MYLTLIYRVVDDELPPKADLLFNACIKRVYSAEDATVLASRICLVMLQNKFSHSLTREITSKMSKSLRNRNIKNIKIPG